MKNKNIKREKLHSKLRNFLKSIYYGFFSMFSDENSIKLYFLLFQRKRVNLKNPETFTEKINYMKIHYRTDIITRCADKIQMKDYVKTLDIDVNIPKVLWEGTDLSKVSLDNLPEKFVLKSNHSTGDINLIQKNQIKSLSSYQDFYNHILKKNPYYSPLREWCYKNIKPTIYIEEFIGENLTDYKFFCFNGRVHYIHVVQDRYKNLKDYILDINWENQNFNFDTRSFTPFQTPPKLTQKTLDKMITIAESISSNFDFLRVDLYFTRGLIYLGELTFYPWAGKYKFISLNDENLDQEIGEKLVLNQFYKNKV